MSTPKVKGIFKGFRRHMFGHEKEPEMQIGFPTDVKHVAHIGWDGPSVNTPSWMNEFKSPPPYSSAPLSLNGSLNNTEHDNGVKWISEDSKRERGSKSANSSGRDLPEKPRSSRRHSPATSIDSPTNEKTEKPRQSRRSSSSKPRDPSDPSKPTRIHSPADSTSTQGGESPATNPADVPRKTRRKKSKENSGGGGGGASSRSRSRAPSSSHGSEPKSASEHGYDGSSEDLARNLL